MLIGVVARCAPVSQQEWPSEIRAHYAAAPSVFLRKVTFEGDKEEFIFATAVASDGSDMWRRGVDGWAYAGRFVFPQDRGSRDKIIGQIERVWSVIAFDIRESMISSGAPADMRVVRKGMLNQSQGFDICFEHARAYFNDRDVLAEFLLWWYLAGERCERALVRQMPRLGW
jgi:hypothetical protein